MSLLAEGVEEHAGQHPCFRLPAQLLPEFLRVAEEAPILSRQAKMPRTKPRVGEGFVPALSH
jgi:hypothetical protein